MGERRRVGLARVHGRSMQPTYREGDLLLVLHGGRPRPGRPAVVQDTKWSRYVPSGSGVIAFDTMEQTLAALDEVQSNWHRHSAAAYELAREYLAPDRVLPRMLEDVFASHGLKTGQPKSP